MATAGRDGRVKVWDATGKPGADLGTAADSVLRVAFTAGREDSCLRRLEW